MNHVKIFKGGPLQDAPSKLVQLWYKSFPPGRFLPCGIISTRQISAWWKWRSQLCWVINAVLHDLVWRIRILRIKSSEQDFKYLYWTISKMLLWNLITCKGTYMIDWVEQIRQSETKRAVQVLSYAWHDSFIRVTWLNRIYAMMHCYVSQYLAVNRDGL